WESDGTADGTVPIPNSSGIVPTNMTAVGNTLFFTARDPSGGPSTFLYRVDGTTLRSIFTGNASSLTAVGEKLFFTAPSGSGGSITLYEEGSSSSVNPVGIRNFVGGLYNLINVNGELYFTEAYLSLWKSDGTAAGTALVATFPNGQLSTSNPTNLTDV